MRPGAVLDAKYIEVWSRQESNFYGSFSSAVNTVFLIFIPVSCVWRELCLQLQTESRNEANRFGFRSLSSKMVSAFFLSRQSRLSGWPRVWLMTSLCHVLKLSSPQLQSSLLKERHRNVFREEAPSPRKPAVGLFFFFLISLFLAQRKWK